MRIHPFFWVTTVLLGLNTGGETPPALLLSWVVAALVSILVHEFGHAVWQRRYGGHPRITLYGMGGLAACDDCDRSSQAQIEISLAGPFAGFLLAALIFVFLKVTGTVIGVQIGNEIPFEELGVESVRALPLLGLLLYWEPFSSDAANHLLSGFLQINIIWGLVNLLPVYPLDGGQVSRELCQIVDPRQGIIRSLQISVFCGAAMVLVGLSWGSIFVAILFGLMAYNSYRTLEAYRASLW